MKGWYKSAITKGFLILLTCCTTLVITIYLSIMVLSGFTGNIFDVPEQFEDSLQFEMHFNEAVHDVTGVNFGGRVVLFNEQEIVDNFPVFPLGEVSIDDEVVIELERDGTRSIWVNGEWFAHIGRNQDVIEISDPESEWDISVIWVEDRGFWVEGEPATYAIVQDIWGQWGHWEHRGFRGFGERSWLFHRWTEGNTNFVYMIIDPERQIIKSNRSALENFDQLEDSIASIRTDDAMKYVIIRDTLAEFESNLNLSSRFPRANSHLGLEEGMIFVGAVDMNLPLRDSFYWERDNAQMGMMFLGDFAWLFLISVPVLLISFIWLTAVAGRNNRNDQVNLNWFDDWKTEIGAGVTIGAWLFITVLLDIGNRIIWWSHNLRHVTFVSIYIMGTLALFLVGYLSLVRRIKAKTLWSNSLLGWVMKHFGEFWSNRDVVLKAFLLITGFIGIHWLALISNGHGLILLMMFASNALAIFVIVKRAVDRKKISKGIQEIAQGNIAYQIPLTGLHGEIYRTAQLVNSIGSGLQKAIEEGMRSERMRTDLITNVSHDIKTPLTSIINYVELLKRGNLEDEKLQGYILILEEKAQRLKILTEDVVEASKLSSGTITFEKTNINLGEMLHQAQGEFKERFEKKNLTLISSIPTEPIVIHVDGRRMWRVIENIFNNVEKYAMPGSRVYGDLTREKQTIVYSLKNISQQPLNITAEELTERFIRGDVSRSTEGSGLGLSIAKSLTQLQGGEFRLYLDGDLFKVIIEFPAV